MQKKEREKGRMGERVMVLFRPFPFSPFLLFSLSAFMLSGCYETHFDFKTIIRPDGSVERVMEMEGQSGHLFKSPEGPGWQSKAWESKGEGTLIANTVYHQRAEGHFFPGSQILSDYAFHGEELSLAWDEETKQRLAELGIKPPYSESFFSRNRIQVQEVKNFLTQTTFYEETFENRGIIEALLSDLKKQVRKEGERKEQKFSDAEIDVMAQLRLEGEILEAITFESEVTLPGKMISTNASSYDKNRARWKFSLKDFENNYSTYVLKAVSRTVLLPGMILIACATLLFLIFVFLFFAGIQRQWKEKKRKKTKPKEKGFQPEGDNL